MLTALGIANRGVCGGNWVERWEEHFQKSHYTNSLAYPASLASRNAARGGWTLNISEGCDIVRSVDATIRVALSPNALYWPKGSN